MDESHIDLAVNVGYTYINLPFVTNNENLRKAKDKLQVIGYVCNVDWMFQQMWLSDTLNYLTSNVFQVFAADQNLVIVVLFVRCFKCSRIVGLFLKPRTL